MSSKHNTCVPLCWLHTSSLSHAVTLPGYNESFSLIKAHAVRLVTVRRIGLLAAFLPHAWQLHLKLIVREDVCVFRVHAAMQVRLFPT